MALALSFKSNGGRDGWVEGLLKVVAVIGDDITGLFGTYPDNGVHLVQAKKTDVLYKEVKPDDILKGKIYPSGPNKFNARDLTRFYDPSGKIRIPPGGVPCVVPSDTLDTATAVAREMHRGGARPPPQPRSQPPARGGARGDNRNGQRKHSNVQRNPVGPPSGANGDRGTSSWGRSSGKPRGGARSPVEGQEKEASAEARPGGGGCNLPMRNSEDQVVSSSPVKKVDVSNVKVPSSDVQPVVKVETLVETEPTTVTAGTKVTENKGTATKETENKGTATKEETAATESEDSKTPSVETADKETPHEENAAKKTEVSKTVPVEAVAKETSPVETFAKETAVAEKPAESSVLPRTPTKLFGSRVVVTSVGPTRVSFDIGDGKTAEIGEQDVVEVGDQQHQTPKKVSFSEVAESLTVGLELDADIEIHGSGETPAKIVKFRGDLPSPVAPAETGHAEDKPAGEVAAKKEEWRVGDTVRALYRDEGVFYEAVVTGEVVVTPEGDYLTVQFVGYGNEEVVWIDEIDGPSAGPDAVQQQMRNAERFADAPEEPEQTAHITGIAIMAEPVVCNDLPGELELPPQNTVQAEEEVVLAGTGPARQTSLDVSTDEAFVPSASDTDAAEDLVQQVNARMSSILACNQVVSTNNVCPKTTKADHTVPQEGTTNKDDSDLFADGASKMNFAKAVEKASSPLGKAAAVATPPVLPSIAEEDVTPVTDLLATPNPIVTDLLDCSISDLPSAQCQIDDRQREIMKKLTKEMTAALERSVEVNSDQLLGWIGSLTQLQRKI